MELAYCCDECKCSHLSSSFPVVWGTFVRPSWGSVEALELVSWIISMPAVRGCGLAVSIGLISDSSAIASYDVCSYVQPFVCKSWELFHFFYSPI